MQALEMIGRICLVTGGNSGIGKETALGLARAGARVVILSRDPVKGKAAVAELSELTSSGRVELLVADLSSQASVREAARQFMRTYPRLDVLVNNAGTFLTRRATSVDGIEMTVATNFLGPFLLTQTLLPLLLESAPSRIINVSSGMHRRAPLDLSDLGLQRGPYRFVDAYATSKLMLNVYSYELARRLRRTGVSVYSMEPGHVASSLGDENGPIVSAVLRCLCRPFLASPQDGARTALYLATSSEVSRDSGKYFADCAPTAPNPLSLDPGVATAVWNWAEATVGLPVSPRLVPIPSRGTWEPAAGTRDLATRRIVFPAPSLLPTLKHPSGPAVFPPQPGPTGRGSVFLAPSLLRGLRAAGHCVEVDLQETRHFLLRHRIGVEQVFQGQGLGHRHQAEARRHA